MLIKCTLVLKLFVNKYDDNIRNYTFQINKITKFTAVLKIIVIILINIVHSNTNKYLNI